MSKFHWIAGATMISLASLALAQETPLTRDEVKAELVRARASGELDGWREQSIDGSSMMATAKSGAGAQGRAFASAGLSRAQVMAELAQARAKGADRYGPEHGGRN